MIVIDSSALVAILRRETEADGFLRIIADADGCLLSSVSLLETSIVMAGRLGDAGSWSELNALVARGGMEVVAHDAGWRKSRETLSFDTGKTAIPQRLTLAIAHRTPLPKCAAWHCCLKGMTLPGQTCCQR